MPLTLQPDCIGNIFEHIKVITLSSSRAWWFNYCPASTSINLCTRKLGDSLQFTFYERHRYDYYINILVTIMLYIIHNNNLRKSIMTILLHSTRRIRIKTILLHSRICISCRISAMLSAYGNYLLFPLQQVPCIHNLA